MKTKVKKHGEKDYSYLIIYVDDVLCIDRDPKQIINHITDVFIIKEECDGEPTVYLRANIRKRKCNVADEDDHESQYSAMGSHSYSKRAVRIVEAQMLKNNLLYPSSHRRIKITI